MVSRVVAGVLLGALAGGRRPGLPCGDEPGPNPAAPGSLRGRNARWNGDAPRVRGPDGPGPDSGPRRSVCGRTLPGARNRDGAGARGDGNREIAGPGAIVCNDSDRAGTVSEARLV